MTQGGLLFVVGTVGGLVAGVIAHEIGHVLAARIIGIPVLKVSVGRGWRVAAFSVGNTHVEWRVWPFAGKVYADFSGSESIWALRFYLLGGILINVIALFMGLKLTWHSSYDLRWLGVGIVISQLVLILDNLFPYSRQFGNETFHSDGKQLLSSRSHAEELNRKFRDIVLEPYMSSTIAESHVDRTNPRIRQHAISALFKAPETKGTAFRDFMSRELASSGLSVAEELYLIDSAITYWLKENPGQHLAEMERLMDRAMEIGNDLKTIRQTRGAVLVALGRYGEAKDQIIASRTDSDRAHEMALNAYFLARAHLGLGEIADASREADAMDKVLQDFDTGQEFQRMSKALRKSIAEVAADDV